MRPSSLARIQPNLWTSSRPSWSRCCPMSRLSIPVTFRCLVGIAIGQAVPRLTRHSLIGLPEPLPDSPGGATQEGVVRKVFALRRCAPVPGCAGLGRCAPCRPLPSRPCGAPAGCALGAAPTGRWPPPPGAAARAGKCLSRLPGTGSLRSACVGSGRCPLALLDRRACGPAPAFGQGGNALARPFPVGGGGVAPTATLGPLAALAVGLAYAAAPPAGLRPAPGCAPTPRLRRPSRCARSWPATLGVGSPFRLTGLATGQPPAPAARHGRGRGGPFRRPGAVTRLRSPTGSANAGACIS